MSWVSVIEKYLHIEWTLWHSVVRITFNVKWWPVVISFYRFHTSVTQGVMSSTGVQMVSTFEQCAWELCRTFQRMLKLNVQNTAQLKLHKIMAVPAVMCNCANCTSNGSDRWNTETAKIKFLRSSAGHKLFSDKHRMNRCSPLSSIHLPSCLKFYLVLYPWSSEKPILKNSPHQNSINIFCSCAHNVCPTHHN